MKQAVMSSPGVIDFREVSVPEITENQVLIKTIRIGICGSDIHVYHGKHPYTSYPVVQGHEVSGKIIETGKNVKDIKAGDMVTIMPQIFCGKCYPCLHDKYHICDELKVLGFQATGVASEYFAIDASKVLVTNEIPNVDAITLIEPVAVAVHALGRVGDVKNKKIFVLGAGPIGNLIGQTAKALGAAKVMVGDISEFRLEIALKSNIDYAINTKIEDIGDALIKNFGADKADYIFDCAGVGFTIEAAIKNARKGSDIVVVAVFSEKPAVDLGLIQDRELRLIGTLMYTKKDFEQAIKLLEENKLNTDILISNKFEFDDYSEAYQYIVKSKDKVMKIIINVD